MSNITPSPYLSLSPAQSNRMAPSNGVKSLGVTKLPTDPLYYADLVLQNVVANTRYRITRRDTGAQLAVGITGSSPSVDDITLSALPAYTNPMLMDIRLRNASGATKYKPFETSAYLYRTGGSAYIIQVVD